LNQKVETFAAAILYLRNFSDVVTCNYIPYFFSIYFCRIMSNPNEITLAEAITMTHAYQNDATFVNQTVATKTSISTYQDLMNQPGCVEIRTYFAKDANGILTTVLVGVDINGNDMTNGIIMDRAYPCPFNCHQNSPLML